MKILSDPHADRLDGPESGIKTVVKYYFAHADKFGIDFVDPMADDYDLLAVHAGITGGNCDVAHLHGIYFTGDYPATRWQHDSNRKIVEAVRHAKVVTVPSKWVQEIFQRDMRFSPEVLPHGVDWEAWQHDYEPEPYVLGYAKNRAGLDVCDPSYLSFLARKMPNISFLSTFHPDGAPDNVKVTGVMPYGTMMTVTQKAAVFVQAVKETFGIHALEACAAGVPVVAYNHGGVIDFIQHGINGYLADPNDIDDLARGLAYCLEHRKKLGANARELAKSWTWENAVQRLRDIYLMAMQDEVTTVGVVIPCYNKENTIERAIKSALEQSLSPDSIVVVDDGSTDGSVEIAERYANEYEKVTLIRQPNQGVSSARNNGIESLGNIKYVCCIDGDDAIAPEFLATCVNALDNDPGLHLAYTSILGIGPEGESGITKWPSEWRFDLQLKRRNQVPTCCVFRRATFDRLGGYRSRYNPAGFGCGSEDAALWTSFGIHGYKCAQVSTKPLFVYSMGVGGTSKPGYHEIDFLQLYPSAHDGIHPLASYASPVNEIAHPVFMYDEPLISVIVPIGPGHMDDVGNAFDSVESQRAFRKWEIIAINDTGKNIPEHLKVTYPYIRWIDTDGSKGAGYSRNRGAEASRGKFLVFLDADDMLLPNFMENVLEAWEMSPAIVYTDYVGSAFISEEEAENQKRIGKLRSWSGPDHLAVIGYPSREPETDYDCQLAQSMPRHPLYHWCLVTCLVPKAWHIEIGGFDENMESWEDVEYHWRMAWYGKCYTRVKEELVVYRFATGRRRMLASAETDSGRQTGQRLLRYIDYKKELITMAGCSGCGGGRSNPVAKSVNTVISATTVSHQARAAIPDDSSFKFYYYTSPNRGDHRLIGAAVFRQQFEGVRMSKAEGGGFRIDYGYHSGGEPRPFLVHVEDARLMPGYFQLAQVRREAPPVERAPLDEPPEIKVTEFAPDTDDNVDPLAKFANQADKEPITHEVDHEPPRNTFESMEAAIAFLNGDIESEFDLQTIPGITAPIASQLSGKTLDDLKAMTRDEWLDIRGVAEVKADMIMSYLAKLEE